MACNDSGVLSPIGAFLKYFKEAKPYHTKLLEILEQYNFEETMTVGIQESMFQELSIINDDLCSVTGFGYSFDDECGFDAVICCDLFSCDGGYGLVFDNSDTLVDTPITTVVGDHSVAVNGNQTSDTFLPILKFNNSTELLLKGNQVSKFSNHNIFAISGYKTFDILSVGGKTIKVSGDISSSINDFAEELILFDSSGNDGKYKIKNFEYNSIDNITEFVLYSNNDLETTTNDGKIRFKIGSYNNGAYQKVSATFDGTNTKIKIFDGKSFTYFGNDLASSNIGSIILKTGFSPQRKMTIEGSDNNDGTYLISDSYYEFGNDRTVIDVVAPLESSGGLGNATLSGYTSASGGFDDDGICYPKSENIIQTGIHESLNIEVINFQ